MIGDDSLLRSYCPPPSTSSSLSPPSSKLPSHVPRRASLLLDHLAFYPHRILLCNSRSNTLWNLRLHRPILLRKEAIHSNPNPLKNSQKTSTPNRRIPRAPNTAPNSQTATREKPSNDGIPRIFFPSNPLHCTIKGTEQTSPNSKVTTQDRSTRFDSGHGTD